jgi:hypothetical protein
MKGVEDAKEATTPDFKGAAKGSPVRGTERMSRQWTTRGSERGSVTDGDGRRRISEGRNRSRFRERTRVANMTEKRRGRRGRKERGMRGGRELPRGSAGGGGRAPEEMAAKRGVGR